MSRWETMEVPAGCANTLRAETDWIGVDSVNERTCSIDGCRGKVKARGWCSKHYHRWQQHGDPLKRLTVPRTGTCSVESCVSPDYIRGYCVMHWGRWRDHGDANYEPNRWIKGDEIGYVAAHYRARSVFGKASAHPCVDCGEQAQHWSYLGGSVKERVAENGLAYSPDPTDYSPRCVPCHARFDGKVA